MYFLHITQKFKKFLHKQITSNMLPGFCGTNWKMIADSNQAAFTLEKKKALLMFYCLIQFRNFKATSFNILYLVTAGLFKNRWGKHGVFAGTVQSMLLILKSNLVSGISPYS